MRRDAARASRARGGSRATIAEVAQRLLSKRWSPEQVAHELRVPFTDQPSRWLCKETIYDTAVSLTRPAQRRRRRQRLQGLQRRGRLTAIRIDR